MKSAPINTETVNTKSKPLVEEPVVNSLPQPIPMNTDDICRLLQANEKYLTDEQIKVVWQAIAYRIRCEIVALHNLSDCELKQLLKKIKRELNERQYY
jgi:hypothetical protein